MSSFPTVFYSSEIQIVMRFSIFNNMFNLSLIFWSLETDNVPPSSQYSLGWRCTECPLRILECWVIFDSEHFHWLSLGRHAILSHYLWNLFKLWPTFLVRQRDMNTFLPTNFFFFFLMTSPLSNWSPCRVSIH